MEILDAQLHTWMPPRPSRPWAPAYRDETRARNLNILLQTTLPAPPETLLVEMAAAGVDGAVLTPQGVYGADNSFELLAAWNYPRKFVVVGRVDPLAERFEEALAGDVSAGMLGVRLIRVDAAQLDASFAACARHGIAVALTLKHPIAPAILKAFNRFSDTQFMIDHLGVGNPPPAYGLPADDPFERLPAVLELARYPNVNLKLTGASAYSREHYPFRDVWPAVREILDVYGPERVLWGADYTRTGSLATYWEHTHYLREIPELGEPELTLIYGQSLRRVLKWAPDAYLDKDGPVSSESTEWQSTSGSHNTRACRARGTGDR
jgi:L-fuconolactonase